MKYYLVDRELLKDLLISDSRLAALERGGVDNWEWYGESISDYLEEVKIKDFEELAERDILALELEEVER